MNQSHKILKKKLATLRKMCGYTQESFSSKIEIGYKHYQKIETGKSKNPRADTLDRMADALDMETWQLLHPDFLSIDRNKIYHLKNPPSQKVAEEKRPSSKKIAKKRGKQN